MFEGMRRTPAAEGMKMLPRAARRKLTNTMISLEEASQSWEGSSVQHRQD